MICKFCNAQIPDGSAECPNCKRKLGKADGILKSPTRGGKTFAAVFSALTLIPAVFILAIDYVWDYAINGKATGYLVGALLVMWICAVLPAVRVLPAPMTAGICFLSVALYVLFVVRKLTGSMEWFSMLVLPAAAILAAFIGLTSALTNAGKLKGWGTAALVSGEASAFCIIWGMLWDNYYHHGIIRLRFSVLCAAGLLALAIIFAAAAYIRRVNTKN